MKTKDTEVLGRQRAVERHVGYELRDRGHSHELIAHKYKMTRSSFIVRTLFDNM